MVGAPISVCSPQDGAALSTLRDADASSQWCPAAWLASTAHDHSHTALDTEAERSDIRATMASPVRMGLSSFIAREIGGRRFGLDY